MSTAHNPTPPVASDIDPEDEDDGEPDVIPRMLQALRDARQQTLDEGIAVTYSDGTKLMREHPDGTKEQIGTVPARVKVDSDFWRRAEQRIAAAKLPS